MAVVYVREKYAQTLDESSEDTYAKSYRRVFEVKCDAEADGPISIRPHLPAFNTFYQEGSRTDTTALLKSVNIARRQSSSSDNGHAFHWLATLTYKFVPVELQAPEQGPGFPRPARRGGFVKVAEVTQFDDDGEPDINAAGQLFDPPLEEERHLGQVAISWASFYFNYDFAMEMVGGVNDSPHWGRKEATLKLDNVEFEERHSDQGYLYYWITAYVSHDSRGFDQKRLNAGMMQLMDLGGGGGFVLRPCVGSDGQPVSSPVPLDADGKQLDLTNVDPTQYKDLVTFKTRKARRISFGALGVP